MDEKEKLPLEETAEEKPASPVEGEKPLEHSAEPTSQGEEPQDPETPSGEQEPQTPEEGIIKKKKVGRYKYHIEASQYYNLLIELEVLNGREKKNRNIAIGFIALACVFAVDAGIHPGNVMAMITAVVLAMVGLMMKNQSRKNAKRSVKAVREGFSLSLEVSSKGIKVQQLGRDGTILPYGGIRMVYDHEGYLYVVTGDRTAMFIQKDPENRNYLAIEKKLRELLKDRYKKS